ncbi:MAG: YihY/virulence factor BrkB family protein [Nocardioidaceae bacterium]
MGFTERLDAFQRRHRWAGFPLGVIYKYVDDQGSYLAALMTYYAFLSLFPLLLMASSILGFVLQGNSDLRDQIFRSALRQFPVIGDQLSRPEGLQGSTVAVVIGALGALYGALGVTHATQNAMNIAWAVPRNKRPNPVLSRLRGLLLLATAGVGILATTFLSTLGSDVDALSTDMGTGLKLLVTVASAAVNAAVFILLFRLATTHRHSLRRAIPGAVTCAVLWQGLQLLGAAYVGHVIRNSTVTNGLFAIVLGMIAYLYLAAVTVVLGVEINVVKAHRLYPRALLTPFTDDVDPTQGDKRAYADYAEATRSKDFENVDVSFDYEGQYASARRRAKHAPEAGSEEESGPPTIPERPVKPHQHY